MSRIHKLNVYGEEVVLNHRQFMQAVSDGVKVKCRCGECLVCKAVKSRQDYLREEHMKCRN